MMVRAITAAGPLPARSRAGMIRHERDWRPGIPIITLSLVVGVFFTMQTMLMALALGCGVNIEWDVFQELLFWVVWALLAPLVVAAVRRWPPTCARFSHRSLLTPRPRWRWRPC